MSTYLLAITPEPIPETDWPKVFSHLAACNPTYHGVIPSGYTALNYMSGEELAERHLLIIGLSLVSNEQAEAGQRVRDRLLARRAP